jgi:dTDP-4-dehydrorhamnose reductase
VIKVLILGAGGMLGHKLMQLWPAKYDVIGTVRKSVRTYHCGGIINRDLLIDNVDVNDFSLLENIFSRIQPHFIINCVGVIKQLEAANDPLIAISINSLLPHKLAGLCRAVDARLIHISTDCVFSGDKGMYRETDISDATDLYGRTKFLGEVGGTNCLTLRTSIIGRELESQNGLIEWFLRSDKKDVQGFRKAIYTGLTTIEFSRVLALVMESSKKLTGVYQVSSDPINKYDLLLLVREAFGVSKNVIPVDTPIIDRSLDSTLFRELMNYRPPSWKNMIQELAVDKSTHRECSS